MLTLNAELIYTIINIIILYLLMKKFLFKPVTDIIEKRQKGIENALEEAEKQKQQANELYCRYQQSISKMQQEGKEIVQQAKNRAEVEYEKLIADAKQEATQIKLSAEKSVAIQEQKAMEEARESIVNLALSMTEKLIEENNTAAADEKKLQEFLTQAGEKQ